MKTEAEPESLGHWSLDPRTMELRASAACRRNHGSRPHEDSTYEQVLASIHPDDRDRVRAAVRRALEEGKDYEEQYRVVLPSGDVRLILARGRFHTHPNGGAPQLAGTTLDVTGGESGLRETERPPRLARREQTILEAAGEGIYGLDATGRVTFSNPAAAKMVGRGAGEMVGRRMHEEVHHSRPDGGPYPARECPIYDTLCDGAVHHAEDEVFWRADGSSFPVSYTATPTIEDGEITGAVVTFTDITSRKRAEEGLRDREERLHIATEAAQLGIWELDLSTNEAPVRSERHDRIFGYENPVENWSLQIFLDHVHPEDRQRVERSFEQALRTGLWEFECRIIRADDGETRWIAARGKFYYERGERGSERGNEPGRAVGTVQDITSRKHAEAEREQVRRRMEFLAEASIRLADSLDWEQTLSEIARLAVPGICDLCIVDTLDSPGEGSSVRRLAAAHHDPEKERLAWKLEERHPVYSDERSGIAEVIRTGRSTLITKVDGEWLDYMSRDESHRRILEGLDLGSIVIVPLVTHGRILGALTLASDGSGRHYDEEDLALAEDLARRAAQSMDNARLYEEQSHAARTLQQSLLPPSLPEIPGMEAAARFRPATSAAGAASGGYNVGGDFYDLFQTPAGWAVVVGDVMGKGVEAAELTAMVRYTLRTAAMSGEPPSSVISTLNSAMLNQRSDLKFCTLAYGLLNETREGGSRLTLCRGGHPPPLVLRAGGAVEEAGKRGLLVGIEPDPGWSDTVVELSEGDSVIFYTDGLTEARNPEGRMFGAQRLEDLAASCRDLGASQTADALERGVAEFQAGENPRDDVALLVIRATGRDE